MSKGSKKSPVAKGRHKELEAAKWLRLQGYEVFHNVSYSGPIDLVAVSPDETLYIDVKSVGVGLDYGVKSFTCRQHEPHRSASRFPKIQVRFLYYYKDQFAWKIGHLRPDWEFE